MNVIPVEGECSDYFFSTVSPWDLGMVIQDGQDRPNSQRANLSTIPHHLLTFGRGHFLSLEGEHEPVYTSPQTPFSIWEPSTVWPRRWEALGPGS